MRTLEFDDVIDTIISGNKLKIEIVVENVREEKDEYTQDELRKINSWISWAKLIMSQLNSVR